MILASKSPRRKEILERLGFHLRIIVPETEENSERSDISGAILDIAAQKTLTAAKIHRDSYVVGADTVVILDGEVIGKPRDAKDAARTLAKLSGREHKVLTGFSFRHWEKNLHISDFAVTSVRFRELGKALIRWYVESGEPLDKAGSYGIQGRGAVLVEEIRGDYLNVVGFPLALFAQRLAEAGITPDQYPLL
ncbi:MAG: Maf family protein [Fusobacteriaceae bacterium]|jgi:septum formation protein|nr:Maf family protein [Fusobacteriaceae bacterium]